MKGRRRIMFKHVCSPPEILILILTWIPNLQVWKDRKFQFEKLNINHVLNQFHGIIIIKYYYRYIIIYIISYFNLFII